MAKPTFNLQLDAHRTEIVRRDSIAGIRVEGMADVAKRLRKAEEAIAAAESDLGAIVKQEDTALEALAVELRGAREGAKNAPDDAEKAAAARRASELERQIRVATEKPSAAILAARQKRDAAKNNYATLQIEMTRAGVLLCAIVVVFKDGTESALLVDESYKERVLMSLATELPHLFQPTAN